MNPKLIILPFLVLSTAFFPAWAQERSPVTNWAEYTEMEWFYMEQASRDAEYEHQLRFSHQTDEIDFWNDQRRFEQELSQTNLRQYQAYRKAKKIAYLKHTEVCKGACGHGDYYLRQASLYLQFDADDSHPYMTFSEVKRGRGWQVSYLPTQNKPD
ncbi:hypothetical protein [Robiginitalea aurantiaca]|uniref:Uncharacterized protein n=1 Tax=Robiginitalea aurantiaca TaxID=3056915 RepID=A0ABT7WB86_9FLAO|nr:hypothetical protein [Robiginitalea aurantiaca]MDM9630180.1 hypothetical protein [Robiginitalea aurantiaca]